ncbi:hypothetical protein [Candidatus Hodgkinia cicadicola]|uniref:hypothetical protein n=1 Tax=Candidatus Hodgkinia cicadicola TaxID=573658 RepID=UPI001788A5CE
MVNICEREVDLDVWVFVAYGCLYSWHVLGRIWSSRRCCNKFQRIGCCYGYSNGFDGVVVWMLGMFRFKKIKFSS